MSYEEFLARAAEHPFAEWVDGEVIVMSPASSKHQRLVRFLSSVLQAFAEKGSLGEVFVAPFQMKPGPGFPGREPDVLFIAKRKLARVRAMFLDGPADLAVEIVSRESRKTDRVVKLREYEKAGVREYWVVDPDRKEAAFHVLGRDGTYKTVEPDAAGVYRSAVMHGLWIRTSWLFADPLPAILDVLREWKIV